MKLHSHFAALAYATTSQASFHLSPLLPARIHAGKRACRALCDLRDAPSGPYFSRAVLESRWKSELLLRYVLGLSKDELSRFFRDRAVFEGAVFAAPMLDGTRPVVLAAPDYGTAPLGYAAAVQRVGTRKTINLFYDPARSSPRVHELFEHAAGRGEASLIGAG